MCTVLQSAAMAARRRRHGGNGGNGGAASFHAPAKGTAALLGTSTGGGNVTVYGELWGGYGGDGGNNYTDTDHKGGGNGGNGASRHGGQPGRWQDRRRDLTLSQDVYAGNGGWRIHGRGRQGRQRLEFPIKSVSSTQ